MIPECGDSGANTIVHTTSKHLGCDFVSYDVMHSCLMSPSGDPEDVGNRFFQNSGNHLEVYIVP